MGDILRIPFPIIPGIEVHLNLSYPTFEYFVGSYREKDMGAHTLSREVMSDLVSLSGLAVGFQCGLNCCYLLLISKLPHLAFIYRIIY